jgi:hypothetical protein
LTGPNRPLVVKEAYQVFECTWQSDLENAVTDKKHIGELDGVEPPYHDFNGITSKFGAHFILKIDKILMKEKFHDAIINGVTKHTFPKVAVDYGYRDSTNFWYTKATKPIAEKIPAGKEADISTVMHAANRIDDKIKFSEEACQTIVRVPRVFLKTVLKSCVDWARENNVELITKEHMALINDKRSKEKR